MIESRLYTELHVCNLKLISELNYNNDSTTKASILNILATLMLKPLIK